MILTELARALTEAASFTKREVGGDDLTAVLEAARLAPSAMNTQIWRFFVARRGDVLDRLAGLAGKPAFTSAPVVITACASPSFLKRRGREQPYFMIDVPIAVSHILLRAAELGLGCAWTYEFDEQEALSLIGAPERYRAVTLVALGHIERRQESIDPDKYHTVEIR